VSRRTKLILSGIGILLAAAVAFALCARFEPFAPRFEGKTVRQYIEESPGEQPLREDMIRAFGLKAIPYLSASCRRSLILDRTRGYLPLRRTWWISYEEQWMRNRSIAYMWIYRLGEENPSAVAMSLANQHDIVNLPRFLYGQCDTNQLANFSTQKTNPFLARQASRVLTLKSSGQSLSQTSREISTFP
jgi:hypothetical protein